MIYTNVLIAIFNILPIYPLDGGRIVNCFLNIIFGNMNAKKITNDVSIIFTIILTAISSIAIYYFKNIAVLLIIIYLWSIVLLENRKLKRMLKINEIVKNI